MRWLVGVETDGLGEAEVMEAETHTNAILWWMAKKGITPAPGWKHELVDVNGDGSYFELDGGGSKLFCQREDGS